MKKKIEIKVCYYLGKKDWQFMLLPTIGGDYHRNLLTIGFIWLFFVFYVRIDYSSKKQ